MQCEYPVGIHPSCASHVGVRRTTRSLFLPFAQVAACVGKEGDATPFAEVTNPTILLLCGHCRSLNTNDAQSPCSSRTLSPLRRQGRLLTRTRASKLKSSTLRLGFAHHGAQKSSPV